MSHWSRVKEIFQSALDRAPEDRRQFLRSVCGDDGELLAAVESLLTAHHDARRVADTGLPIRDFAFSMVGRQIGAYRIMSLIGTGGMGDVYRAHDAKLERDVAIKVLPAIFTAGADRLSRFEREARALAALNHPHIGAIYGFEEADGVHALVLELVEGDTLAEFLARSGGRVAEDVARSIARQIAEALEAAHDKGLVHRDLKPSNIKITADGSVKVLDFGLAKAVNGNASAEATADGMVLGTAAYMSPEQARGQAVDKRTDVWAFGCVLYEMLTGRPAFAAATISDTIAAVIRSEPDWSVLPANLPPTIRAFLRQCLQKNPRDRVHDMADLRLALDGGFDVVSETKPASLTRMVVVVAIGIAAIGAINMSWLLSRAERRQQATASVRLTVTTPPLEIGPATSTLAISPDGTHLAYVAGEGVARQLYIRRFDSFEAKAIVGSEGAFGPFFSPDGHWVAFFALGVLKKVSVSGGAAVTICDALTSTQGGTWGSGETIFFESGGLWRVSANDGHLEQVFSADVWWPDYIDQHDAIVFTGINAAQVWVHSFRTGQRRLLIERGSYARYVDSGHLVYALDGSLMAAPFDPVRLELTGPPVRVVENLMMMLPPNTRAHFAVSRSGTLAYLTGPVHSLIQTLHWVDRRGNEESIDVPPGAYNWPRISPDGTRFAVDVQRGSNRDIWIYDVTRKIFQPLTFDNADDGRAVWTPDGEHVIYRSGRDGAGFHLFRRRAGGRGQAERLTAEPNDDRSAWGVTKDGTAVVVTELSPSTGLDLHLLSLDTRQQRPLVVEKNVQGSAAISRDGRWIAYRSNDTGRYQIHVRPFPAVKDGLWQVTTDGGISPVWAPNTRELFYRTAGAMMVVPVETDSEFTFGTPRRLFPERNATGLGTNFDVSPDGQRFLVIKNTAPPVDPSDRDEISIVLNWFAELTRSAPNGRR